jgi:hypothetical protein
VGGEEGFFGTEVEDKKSSEIQLERIELVFWLNKETIEAWRRWDWIIVFRVRLISVPDEISANLKIINHVTLGIQALSIC